MNIKHRPSVEIEYPESDGKPMAETDVHRDWMVQVIQWLQAFFAGQWVYISGNLLLYYVQGDPKRSEAPDVFVVKECDPRKRRVYKLWEEGKGPNFALEVTSIKTRAKDRGPKMRLYAELKVPEYFLYDPLGDWLNPPLQGYRLTDGEYVRLEEEAGGGIVSEQLGVTFRLEEGQLALFGTATGERLKTLDAKRADEEAAARRALEEELAQLRAERGR